MREGGSNFGDLKKGDLVGIYCMSPVFQFLLHFYGKCFLKFFVNFYQAHGAV